MSGDALVARIRDLRQVEALLGWAQARYREQLAAWLDGDRRDPPPTVPDGYRQAVARLQVALGHLDLAAARLATTSAPPAAPGAGEGA